MYAYIWCKHDHTLFVLVSFQVKKSNNFTFMATLVEPPLGVVPMTPNPFSNLAHELCSFVILWCDFSLLHHEGLEGVEEG